ncbi:AbrB/MazE/SpoVT family DNA-binding domain-containing protein, partial [Nocardia abscessus]|uniref:AbrB/MazE/SpoVT family DNA-binding domain-containing protein n=1 Tax=Nocardia abscessus TaxID=120957 RepID=UPI0024565255
MTEDTLLPVLPSFCAVDRPAGNRAVSGAPGLPLGNVEQPPARTAVHSIRPVDSNGRVVDKAVLTALDWRPGDQLSWRVAGGVLVLT